MRTVRCARIKSLQCYWPRKADAMRGQERQTSKSLVRKLQLPPPPNRNPSAGSMTAPAQAGAGSGAGAGAAIGAGFGFGAAALRFGAAFFAVFFFVTFFAFDLSVFLLLAGRSGLLLFPGFLLRFCLLRHDRPPDLAIAIQSVRPPRMRSGETVSVTRRRPGPVQPAVAQGRIAARGRCSRSLGGQGPPVAQSINSTVWTAGRSVPAAICVMQPILPAAITSGRNLSIVPTLRSRNLLAMSGCRIL